MSLLLINKIVELFIILVAGYAIVKAGALKSSDAKALSIITGELARAIQFGEGAENPACVTDLKNIAVDFHIDYRTLNDEGIEEEDEDE